MEVLYLLVWLALCFWSFVELPASIFIMVFMLGILTLSVICGINNVIGIQKQILDRLEKINNSQNQGK